MAPRSAKRGAAKKPSTRSKTSNPSTPDPSLVPFLPLSEEKADSTPNVVDQVLVVETYDSVAEDDVVGGEDPPPSDTTEERNTLSIEEIESASVTPMEIMETKGVEGTVNEPDAEKSTPNELPAIELENAEKSKVSFSEELGSDKMSQEPKLLLAPLFEDAVPSGTGDEMNTDEGLKENVGEDIGEDDKKTVTGITGNVTDCVKGISVNHDSTNYTNEENEENEESDQEFYMQTMLMEGKERKESEIFIGGFRKTVVEDDLINVFKAFGEIQSVRIAKNRFAFIRFSSDDSAMKALNELKDGIEVNGKRVRVQANHDNGTLFLDNISKAWTRDHVIETLKSFGVDQMEGLILPEDPMIEGKIKGFAFLEFSSNCDSVAAFERLRKPDVFFGRDAAAKVLHLRAPLHPSQEAILQIKTMCIEGIPLSWDEEKIREICKKYGQIERVMFSRNFSSSKRKDIGFVKFSSHESAVASVDGINNAQLGDGDTNIRASLCKPLNKGPQHSEANHEVARKKKKKVKSKGVEHVEEIQLKLKNVIETGPSDHQHTKQDDRGASVINKDSEANQEVARKKKKKKKVKSKGVEHKAEIQLKLKNLIETGPSETENKGSNGGPDFQISKSVKRKNVSGKATEAALQGFSKKMKLHHNHNDDFTGKVNGQQSSRARKKKSSYPKNSKKNSGSHLAAYAARQQRRTNSEYYAYSAASERQLRRSDLEPHAGYLPAVKRVSTTYEYDRRRSEAFNSERRRIPSFSRAMQRQPTSYLEYARYADHQPFGAYALRGPYYQENQGLYPTNTRNFSGN